MVLSKATKLHIGLFVSAFVLCGVLRVLLYGKDFACSFSLLFMGAVTVLWATTVQRRITDRRLRRLLLGIAAFLLLHFLLQLLRYDLVKEQTAAHRYLWYAMYLPLTAQPLLCILIAFSIYRPKEKPLPRISWLLLAVGVLLVLGVLTNDLHFWAKSFPGGVLEDNGQEVNGWLYYAVNIYIYGLYALALVVILKKNRRYVGNRYRWLDAVPLLIGVMYFLLYPLDIGHRFFTTRLWQMGEMSAFCIIASLETCIQLGMIPENRAYEALFSVTDYPAVILDGAGRPAYRTAGAEYPFPDREDVELISHAIWGGSVEYPVDMSRVNSLNRQLEERARQIEARNAYLEEEARVKKERAELETRNRLYEDISNIVRPQLEEIDRLAAMEDCGIPELTRIAVLKAYIKRRSNMALLEEDGKLTLSELTTAVAETMDYLRLCGANTASGVIGAGLYSAAMITAAYEEIEAILEANLDTLRDMAVIIRGGRGAFTVRIMLRADNFSYGVSEPELNSPAFRRSVTVAKEDRDLIIVLTFTEGGDGG